MKTRDVPAPDMPSDKKPREQWLSEDGLRPVPHSTDEPKVGEVADASPKGPAPATAGDEKPASTRTP